jgi:predicted dehydrogenase
MAAKRFSRRGFLKASSGLALGWTFIPRTVWGANQRVNVGCIGIGGKGAGEVADISAAGGNIVALCDVDQRRRVKKGQDATELHPKAKFYRDFRIMLDKEKGLDAVSVSTPDHTHCVAAVTAMRLGKHVYCQKPLTHSIWEARLMRETARKHKVATQMGNQAHAGAPIRRAVELVRAGLVGKVREVHAWTNRPIWPQGMAVRPEPQQVPSGLDWDLWLGPAPERPYNEAYVPFKWRGWWDFGTGALGDMGCHILDMPFWALELNWPSSVEADQEGNTRESGPRASTVTWTFPAGPYSTELKYVWYDGGRMPPAELIAEAEQAEAPPASRAAKQAGKKQAAKRAASAGARRFDLVMIGEKGKFFFNRGNLDFLLAPASLLDAVQDTPETIRRVRSEDHEWLEACQGGPDALSNFDYAARLTEMVLLGNVAIRTGQKIQWDGPAMKAVNCPDADQYIRREYRKGWEL